MFLKLFISVLEKLPSLPITMLLEITDNIRGSDIVEGQMCTWSSINSCSSDVKVAGFYVGPGGTLFCIHALNGKDITKFSANQDENEVILMPGTCLREKSASLDINGLYVVHLDEW